MFCIGVRVGDGVGVGVCVGVGVDVVSLLVIPVTTMCATFRSLSDDSVAFVKAMVNPAATNLDRISLLKRAADSHQV